MASGQGDVLFHPGHVFLNTAPFVISLCAKEKSKRCDNCLRPRAPLMRCAGCASFYYCDRRCQTKDWKSFHKYECNMYSRAVESDLLSEYYQHGSTLFLRIMTLLKVNSELIEKEIVTVSGSKITIKSLLDREYNHVLFDSKFESLHLILTKLGVTQDKKFLKNLYLVTMVYNLDIEDYRLDRPASCFLPQTTTSEHSCLPNSWVCFDVDSSGNRSVQVRALRKINNGEKITISYIDSRNMTSDRQKLLQKRLIDCTCSRCEDKHMDVILINARKLEIRRVELETTNGNLEQIYKLINECIDLNEKFHGPYHPQLLIDISDAIRVREKMDLVVSTDMEVPRLLKKLLAVVKVTHGMQHSLYQQYGKFGISQEALDEFYPDHE